jgi:hypothetical protein
MTTFKEFAIGKFVLRFYKTDHVWTCTATENMLDEVTKELALQKLSDIGQEIENEPSVQKSEISTLRELTDEEIENAYWSLVGKQHEGKIASYLYNFARDILQKASEK